MPGKLPLDSPLWDRMSACYSTQNAIARLREIVATRQLGEAWSGLREEILHQGSVYGVSSAAIPHLVDVAPDLPAGRGVTCGSRWGSWSRPAPAASVPRPRRACRRP